MSKPNLLVRFRKWLVIAIAFGAMLYLGGSIYADWDEVTNAVSGFQWWILVPVCALTLLNYALRFAKWRYLTRRLGVRMPLSEDAWNFASGLAMIISPGKVGELLKPYVVRDRTGVPMDDLTWWWTLACYKLGIILEGTNARAAAGRAPAETGRDLHDRAVRLLTMAGHLVDGTVT